MHDSLVYGAIPTLRAVLRSFSSSVNGLSGWRSRMMQPAVVNGG